MDERIKNNFPFPGMQPGDIVEKPWGTERWIACNAHYALRELVIRAGHAVSLQYHERKIETLYVLEGSAVYYTQEPGEEMQERIVKAGDILSNHPYLIHRQRAIEDFRFIEVTTPELDDIIRLQDDYNRGSHTV